MSDPLWYVIHENGRFYAAKDRIIQDEEGEYELRPCPAATDRGWDTREQAQAEADAINANIFAAYTEEESS